MPYFSNTESVGFCAKLVLGTIQGSKSDFGCSSVINLFSEFGITEHLRLLGPASAQALNKNTSEAVPGSG